MDIERRRERQRANKENARQRAREYIAEYFATHPCVDCGETDSIVLTFDHLPGKHKTRADVSELLHDGYGLDTIKAEIAKTDVVCFNCHSLRTQQRTGAYRFRMSKVGKQ
jgi:5-methylcytosine-specific restriction endonuclease McrA